MQTVPGEDLDANDASFTAEGSSQRPMLERLGRLHRIGEWPNRFIVLAVTVFVFVQLRPGLLFGPNLDVGGDNAAHVTAVYYFIHHLLLHGKLSGWDPQWFDGFPLYVFYFPFPAVLVAIFNVAFPYSVAFNLVTVLGSLLVPVAFYSFGKLAGFRRPAPVVMSVLSLGFLFNTSFTIDGGNIASTLAGEFSFSLAIPLGLFFLGLYVRSFRTGRGRALAAMLFALTMLSHVVPGLFYLFSAFVIALMQADRRRSLKVFVTTCGVGILLAGFWLVRFASDLGFSSSMNYTRVGDVFAHILPHNIELSIQILAAIGLLIAIRRRDELVLALGVVAIASVIAFAILPDGLVYNERWEPFWFLTTTILAGYGLAESARIFADVFVVGRRFFAPIAMWTTFVAVIVIVAVNLNVMPGYATPSNWQSFVPGWVQWNYSGYQGKPGWSEFNRVVAMLKSAGAKYGCGRLDYEYTPNATDPFGSTLVEMSIPMWTNGCIDTTEGLYYESSTTNDFHFLDQSELSIDPSNPVVGLPYQGLNVADGVRHLQLAGVKYFLANSAEVENQAANDPSLARIASTPATTNVVESSPAGTPGSRNPLWVLYEISDAPLVSSVSYLPVVEAGQSKQTWLNTAIDWYQHRDSWDMALVRNGPSNWPHARPGALITTSSPLAHFVAPTRVTNVATSDDSISFDVARVGVPVIVKIPYFPNWQASGAEGPYEVSPNFMAVVPTSRHVSLHYGTTGRDWVGRVASLVGVGGLIALWRRPLEPLPAPSAPEDAFTPGEDAETDAELFTGETSEPVDNGEAPES